MKQDVDYPTVLDSTRVGTYPARSKAGGGFVWDEVLEYRVWCSPHDGAEDKAAGSDYFYAFPTYGEANAFADDSVGAEDTAGPDSPTRVYRGTRGGPLSTQARRAHYRMAGSIPFPTPENGYDDSGFLSPKRRPTAWTSYAVWCHKLYLNASPSPVRLASSMSFRTNLCSAATPPERVVIADFSLQRFLSDLQTAVDNRDGDSLSTTSLLRS